VTRSPAIGFSVLLLVSCASAPIQKAEPARTEAPAVKPGPPVGWTRAPAPGPLPVVIRKPPVHLERTLGNGLRVVVIEQRQRPLVRVRLVFPNGAAGEGDSVAGVTNMSLALLCDRFENRNSEDELIVWDEKSARRKMMDAGGSLRSFVAADSSGLAIDGYASDVSAYLTTLNEIIHSRRHGVDGFTGRRDALLDAIDDLELGDDATMYERLFELAFGAQHPYARRLVGTKVSLAALGMEDVVDVQNRLLHPQGAVLLIVGDVKGPEVLLKAAQVFGPWSKQGRLVEQATINPPPVLKRASVVVVPRQPARTTALCAARPLTDVDASNGAIAVLAELVGSQRLNEALREGPGLTYSASAGSVRHRKARAFLICTRLPTKDTVAGLRIFMSTLSKLQQTPVTEAEVERAKAVIISQLQGGYDDIASSTQTWLAALDVNETPALPARIAEVRSVTAAQISGLAAKVLAAETLQLVLSGDSWQIGQAISANKLGKVATVRAAHE
jgi:zinc protease